MLASFYGLNLYAVGGIGAGLTIDCTNKVLNPKMGDLRIPITITPNISVGLTVAVLNPNLLSATAGLQFDFNIECYMDYNSVLKADDKACPECWEISDNGFEYDNFHVTMWLKSSATAVGFQMIENTYQVFDIHSINQLSF